MTKQEMVTQLEAALEMERDLGVRTLDVSADFAKELKAALAPAACPSGRNASPRPITMAPTSCEAASSHASRAPESAPALEEAGPLLAFVLLHERPLGAKAREMMAKAVAALGATEATAPVISSGALPKAKVYVVLGSLALRKWFPTLHATPGQCLEGPSGEMVFVTYSPERVLMSSPALLETTKKSFWKHLVEAAKRAKA